MAFVKAVLKKDLSDCFEAMTDGDNRRFSQGMARAFKDFVESGVPVTTDTGTIPIGTFTGASTEGSMTSDGSGCEDIIYRACEDMNGMRDGGGGDHLARKIAEGLQDLTDGTVVNTSVSGVAVPPSPPPPSIPAAGKAQGGIDCVTKPVEEGLRACFSAMVNMAEGGNEYLAETLSTLVNSCLMSGVVSTDGLGNLAGSKGSGRAT